MESIKVTRCVLDEKTKIEQNNNQRIPKKLEKLNKLVADIQSYKVLNSRSFKSKMFRSLPSKVLVFLSLHRHHNTQ
jgi:hypothetical protein